MKVRNIIFSGFAAAILMGTVDANAAFTIASKDYVDSKVSTGLVDESTGKEISIAEALGAKADKSAVDALAETVGDENDGLVKDVADLQTAVGDTTGGLVKDVDDLQTAVGDTTGGLVKDVADNSDAIDALGQRVTANENIISNGTETLPSTIGSTQNVSTIVGAINALQTKTDSMATSETMDQVTSDIEDIKDALGDGFDGNNTVADALADKADASAVDAALGDGIGAGEGDKTVAAALAEKQDTLSEDQLKAVNSGIDATKVAAYDATQTAMKSSCTSESDYCVLVKNKDTQEMEWAGITLPFSMSVEP